MQVTINITKITVLTGYGADKVTLHTDLPSGTPAVSREPLSLSLEAARGEGEAYAGKHFPGLPIEVINMRG